MLSKVQITLKNAFRVIKYLSKIPVKLPKIELLGLLSLQKFVEICKRFSRFDKIF